MAKGKWVNREAWSERVYALYKGDVFITDGTIQEIHKSTGRSIRSLRDMTTPYYIKVRCGDSLGRLRMVSLDDEDE